MRAFYLTAVVASVAALPTSAPAATVSATLGAPFACQARVNTVCYFRIFYPGGYGRDVVLPAGMKVSIPDVRAGQDSYCVALDRKPAHPCTRKLINTISNI